MSRPRPPARHLGALALICTLAGCAAIPKDGPMPGILRHEARNNHADLPNGIVLLPATDEIVRLAESEAPMPAVQMPETGSAADRIGPGDALGVTIVENGPGGLFSSPTQSETAPGTSQAPAGARVTNLPDLTVAQDGTVAFPYIGRLYVRGETPGQLAAALRQRLSAKTVEPEVVVSVHGDQSNTLTVGGSVAHPGTYPIPTRGERVLEAVARAGGTSIDPSEAMIRLVRDGRSWINSTQTLLDQPDHNVHLQSGDYLDVVRRPRSVLVFGALGKPSSMPLPLYRYSLAEGIAASQGLDDSRSDPSGVFVFREVPAGLLRQMVLVARAHLAKAGVGEHGLPPIIPASYPDDMLVPTVVNFDFNTAFGMFLAKRLTLREQDMIYVGNARVTQWTKFMQLVRLGSSGASTGARSASY